MKVWEVACDSGQYEAMMYMCTVFMLEYISKSNQMFKLNQC